MIISDSHKVKTIIQDIGNDETMGNLPCEKLGWERKRCSSMLPVVNPSFICFGHCVPGRTVRPHCLVIIGQGHSCASAPGQLVTRMWLETVDVWMDVWLKVVESTLWSFLTYKVTEIIQGIHNLSQIIN